MTKEAIIKQHPILVYIIDAHGSGAFQLMNKAMDEYAKLKCIAFMKWALESDKVVGDNWGDAFIPHPETEETIYQQFENQFIEQQNKGNG